MDAKDFNNRYGETYVQYNNKVAFCAGVVDDGNIVQLRYVDTQNWENVPYKMHHKVLPWWPKEGYYNVGKYGPMYIYRTGHRQFKRSCCDQSVKFDHTLRDVTMPVWAKTGHKLWNGVSWPDYTRWHQYPGHCFQLPWMSFEFIHSLIDHKFPTWGTAFDLLETKFFAAVAVSPEFALMGDYNDKGINMYFISHPIARVTRTTIEVIDPVFEQEIQDFVRRARVPVVVA